MNRHPSCTAFVVATHQTVDVELCIEAALLVFRDQGAVDRLFDAHQPRADGMDRKGNVLRFDVGKRRALQIADHVRRHAEDAADLRHLKLPRFQELRLVVGNRQGRKRHALFQHRDTAGVSRAAIGRVPARAQRGGVLYRIGMRQDARGPRAVGKELAAIFLGGDAQADGRLLQRDGAVAHDAVKAKPGNVQHVLRGKIGDLSVGGRVGIAS